MTLDRRSARKTRSYEAEALARVTRELMDARTLEEVGDLAWHEAATLLGAERGAFYLLDVANEELVLVGQPGISDALTARAARVPLAFPIAATDSVRLGAPVAIENPSQYAARYPVALAQFYTDVSDRPPAATLAVPVRGSSSIIGSLSFAFARPCPLREREIWLAQSFADAAASAIERLRLFEAEHTARERASRLAGAVAAMLEASNIAAVGEIVLSEARALDQALTGSFTLKDPTDGSLVTYALFGYADADTAASRRLPGSTVSAISIAMHAGETVVLDKASYVTRFPTLAESFLRAGNEGVISVPLATHGRILGGFTVGFGKPDSVGRDERTFLETLATAAAASIERLRAIDAERRHKEESEALARVTSALMEAETLEEVGELAWTEAAALLGAFRGAFYLLEAEADELVLIGRAGLSEKLQESVARIPLSLPIAATDVVRTGRAVAIEDPDTYRSRYPGLAETVFAPGEADAPPAATLVVPVRGRDEVIGSLGFAFIQARKFSERDIWLAQSFAYAAASATARLRVLEAERSARAKSAALARASTEMFEASDPSTVGEIVLREIDVVTDAYTGTVALLDAADDTIYAIATFGYPADTMPRAIRRPAAERSAIAEAIRTGKTAVTDGAEAYQALYPDFADAIRSAGCQSFVNIPLTAHGHTFGAVGVAYRDRRRVGPHDVAFLESIAATAAEAIERLRAHRLLETVVSQMPVGVTVSDSQGRLIATNRMVAELSLGMKPGASVQDYGQWQGFHPDGQPYAAEDWPLARSLRRGEIVLDESIEVERSDGSRATIEYSSAPVRDEHSSIIAGVVVLADVSGRVAAERAREAFLAVLSHELRTPITSILLAGRQLRGGLRKLTAGARRGLYVDIEAEAERLNRVVENLLVLSRIERGATFAPCEPVLFQRLLPAMVSAEQKLWPDVRFHLKCGSGLPVIQGEPGYLEQIVRNLLANAAKYAGGDVDVSLAVREGELVLQVNDRGPGISAEDRPHVFDLFYRAQGTKSAVGAGIGLFVVRNLVEAMGGRVWAAESDEGGACFSVALAALPAETA